MDCQGTQNRIVLLIRPRRATRVSEKIVGSVMIWKGEILYGSEGESCSFAPFWNRTFLLQGRMLHLSGRSPPGSSTVRLSCVAALQTPSSKPVRRLSLTRFSLPLPPLSLLHCCLSLSLSPTSLSLYLPDSLSASFPLLLVSVALPHFCLSPHFSPLFVSLLLFLFSYYDYRLHAAFSFLGERFRCSIVLVGFPLHYNAVSCSLS